VVCCSSNNKNQVSQFISAVLPSVTSSNVDKYWSLNLSLSQQIRYSCSNRARQTSEHFLSSHHTHTFYHSTHSVSHLTISHITTFYFTYWGLRSRYDSRAKFSHFTSLCNIRRTPLENHCLLSRILTTANHNNHINKRCLVTDFSIIEVLTSIAR
jgi:hypothetical protein